MPIFNVCKCRSALFLFYLAVKSQSGHHTWEKPQWCLLFVSLAKSALKLKDSQFWKDNTLHAVEKLPSSSLSLKSFQLVSQQLTVQLSVISSEVIRYTKKLLHLNIMDFPPFEKENHPERDGVPGSCLGVGFMTGSRIGTN